MKQALAILFSLIVSSIIPAAAPAGSVPLASAGGESLTLWYPAPASLANWNAALPIGNGRLGAMIFGGVGEERLQLNEDTLSAGGPYDPSHADALTALPEVRRLIFEGNYAEAQKLAGTNMLSRPPRQMQYQTIGDLLLKFPKAEAVEIYRRDLNLDTARASVTYKSGGVTFTREMFSSPVDQVLVVRLTADKPGKISFSARIKTPHKATSRTEGTDTLILDGVNGDAQGIKGALKFQARLLVQAKGGRQQSGNATATNATPATEDRFIEVDGADSAILLIAAGTSYKTFQDVSGDPEAIVKAQLKAARRKSFDTLLEAHVKEHQRLFRRMEINLGKTEAMKLPTDERIKNFGNGNDPDLAALYFQFARYLLICSSRPGDQPANLQGIWNESLTPPWGSKYTININTEMNYWPAESCNLAECVEPLTAMVMDLTKTGSRTAKVMYGASGWVAHHNTDLWRATGPIDGAQYGMWPSGGAWLCQNLWEHYLYGGDKKYLARIYPAMRGAAEFFLDTLVEEPTHKWLVTSPSLSPENRHPKGASICAGPAMDSQILRDLFANCIQAATILDRDPEFRKQLAATRGRLAPDQIGKEGQLQEWLEDWDMEAPDRQHRHVSHLYGLFPSAQISLRRTPQLAVAGRKSLDLRGDLATGWAIAWRINLWARLRDAERTYSILKLLLEPSRTYPNMFDAHPPFQIDGNFGGASGIAEMLLQSHEMYRAPASDTDSFIIELLPALPKAWPNGFVRGLRARGGFTVNLEWKNGQLVSATVLSDAGNRCRLQYHDTKLDVNIAKGSTFRWE